MVVVRGSRATRSFVADGGAGTPSDNPDPRGYDSSRTAEARWRRASVAAHMKMTAWGVMVCTSWLICGCGVDGRGRLGDPPDRAMMSESLAAACGDGIVDAGEQCDDGNLASHDGCSAACTLELVAQFAFLGGAGSEPTAAASAADPDLAAIPVISRGVGVTPAPASEAFSAAEWTTAAVLDPDDFFSFTVAPAAGTQMALLALQFDERRSATGIRSGALRSSLDGFASDLAVFAVPDDTAFRTQSSALPPAFLGLVTAVEFRLYGFGAEASGGTWRVDNVTLIGEVARPCGNGRLDPGEQCDDGNAADHDGCSAACTVERVAEFTFSGAAGSEATFAADLADPGLATTPVMSRGAGVAPSPAVDAFSASRWTTGTALDADDYFSFSVAPSAGTALDLVALQLDERRSGTGIRGWSVRSSLDGFATDLAVFAVPDDTLFRTETVALPAALRGVTAAIELRIYGFAAEADGGTWRIDNATLIGEVVPTCGNGVLDPGEQCDDGNRSAGDGCSPACQLEICGNGVVEGNEQCDDGNAVDGDGCEASCAFTPILYAKSSNTGSNDSFAAHIAVSADGSTMAIAADAEDSAATGINGNQADNSLRNAGAVYIFARTGATWQQQAYIKASNSGMDDSFGWAIALSADGSTLAVGAFGEDSSATGINGNQASESATDAGAVYVFTRSGTTWSQQAYVKASNTGAGDQFGISVALSADGSTMAVGALTEDSASTGINGNQTNDNGGNSGAVYAFTRSGTTWTQQAYLKASNTGVLDAFGCDVALSGDGATLVVGATGEASAATGSDGDQSDNSASGAGAAYVFTRSGTTWSQQAYLKASNPGSGDQFGKHVALSNDGATLAIAAWFEDSSATGVGGNQADNTASASGAAYVFARSGTTWSQQAYIKASNTGAEDRFGIGIALSGDGSTLAVGASLEDSAAIGIDGNQASNAAVDSGAAYEFVRSGTTWNQAAYIKASNTGTSDAFGFGLALTVDGSMLVVGAPSESSSAVGIGGNQASDGSSRSGAAYVYR
jgi:cysteine-rich repeat protein